MREVRVRFTCSVTKFFRSCSIVQCHGGCAPFTKFLCFGGLRVDECFCDSLGVVKMLGASEFSDYIGA